MMTCHRHRSSPAIRGIAYERPIHNAMILGNIPCFTKYFPKFQGQQCTDLSPREGGLGLSKIRSIPCSSDRSTGRMGLCVWFCTFNPILKCLGPSDIVQDGLSGCTCGSVPHNNDTWYRLREAYSHRVLYRTAWLLLVRVGLYRHSFHERCSH